MFRSSNTLASLVQTYLRREIRRGLVNPARLIAFPTIEASETNYLFLLGRGCSRSYGPVSLL